MLQVSASPSFNRVAKKLHTRDKKTLDEAIKAILQIRNWAKKGKATTRMCSSTNSN
jgi:hypothetical protein